MRGERPLWKRRDVLRVPAAVAVAIRNVVALPHRPVVGDRATRVANRPDPESLNPFYERRVVVRDLNDGAKHGVVAEQPSIGRNSEGFGPQHDFCGTQCEPHCMINKDNLKTSNLHVRGTLNVAGIGILCLAPNRRKRWICTAALCPPTDI